MKILSFDCGMGAAGDMLAAALFELLPDHLRNEFLKTMNALIPGVSVQTEQIKKCGIIGTKFSVMINGQSESIDGAEEAPHSTHLAHVHHRQPLVNHHGRSVLEVNKVITSLPIPAAVSAHAQAIYDLLAYAESQVHGEPVNQIHFHEIGELDAIADIVAVCLLIDGLNPDRIFCSPVHVGSGQVRCAHGLLPVPAPATAQLLMDVPIYSGTIRGELCTPTGAALLKHYCSFDHQPVMMPKAIGYGMGTKDFGAANCVRAMLCEEESAADTVAELRCNLDDMTPEAIGFAIERLWEGPVLDVFTQPISMKKGRPGTMLCCLCKSVDAPKVVKLLLQHTSTLGIRESLCNRYTLNRSIKTIHSEWGELRIKESIGWGVCREKIEYDDAARVAIAKGIPLSEAFQMVFDLSRHSTDRT